MHMIAVNAFDYIQAPTPHCWPHLPQRPASWRWSCLCPLSPQLLMLSARHTWHLIFPQENKDEFADHMWILAGGFLTRKFSHCCCPAPARLLGISLWFLLTDGEVSTVSRGRCFLSSHSFCHRPPTTATTCVCARLLRGLQCGLVWWGNNVGLKWLLLLVIIRI